MQFTSEYMKARWRDPEFRARLQNSAFNRKGIKQTPEHRAAIGAAVRAAKARKRAAESDQATA